MVHFEGRKRKGECCNYTIISKININPRGQGIKLLGFFSFGPQEISLSFFFNLKFSYFFSFIYLLGGARGSHVCVTVHVWSLGTIWGSQLRPSTMQVHGIELRSWWHAFTCFLVSSQAFLRVLLQILLCLLWVDSVILNKCSGTHLSVFVLYACVFLLDSYHYNSST